MDLAERFRAAVTEAFDEQTACAELVPMVLAQACVQVLPVAGAGLSLTDELRVPLGASDHDVAAAERLQTTLGEGPCLTATKLREPLKADLRTIEARWPMFHRQLVAETPFRSIVSVPLSSVDKQHRLGALDLYLTIPEAVPDFFVEQVAHLIGEPISGVLFDGEVTGSRSTIALPPWLDSAPARDRLTVWVAVGILIEFSRMTNADSLSALRAYAFSHDLTLDDIAGEMVSERLLPEALLA